MKTEYTKKYNSEDDNSSEDNKSSSDEEEGKKSLNTPQTNEIGAAQKTLKPPLVRHLSHERPAKEKANGKRFLLHC